MMGELWAGDGVLGGAGSARGDRWQRGGLAGRGAPRGDKGAGLPRLTRVWVSAGRQGRGPPRGDRLRFAG